MNTLYFSFVCDRKFCENSAYKGSACYAKLSATGKYGRRACVCDEEDLEVVDDSADGDYAEDCEDQQIRYWLSVSSCNENFTVYF